MLSILKKLVVGFVCLFVLFVLGALWFDAHASYWLSIANPGKDPATVKISGYDRPVTVPAGQDLSLEITGQNDASLKNEEQTFTVERAGKTETFKLKLGRDKITVILDAAGGSCFVWADVGGMYAGDRLPKGQAPVKILKTYSGQRLFIPMHFSESFKMDLPVFVNYRPGDKLPESVKVSRGSTSVPSVERIIRVPCELQGVDLFKHVGSK